MSKAREAFIKKYGALAIEATKNTGIFPEVLLAQAIIESSRDGIPGKSTLSAKYNNYHGIKAYPKWKGKTVNLKTREVYDGNETFENGRFVVYDSIEDGFKGYVNFLKENPRYAKAGVFTANSITQQIQALKNAGYATDPEYVTLTNNIAIRVKDWLSTVRPASIFGVVLMGSFIGLLFF
jgi:flagellum-specific peptidoglycan hydrolase FlgJ